jgi:hypothetical protein
MPRKAAKESNPAEPALGRRYGSIAEIKREFFPQAAAEEEAEATLSREAGSYEDLMSELFGREAQTHV